MSLTCKKCSFVNEAVGVSMIDACPRCGAIYSKVEAYLTFMADKQRREAEQKKLEADKVEQAEKQRQDTVAKQAERERQEAERKRHYAEAEAAQKNASGVPRPTLIDCPACETKISSAAIACPKCGHPMKEVASTSETNASPWIIAEENLKHAVPAATCKPDRALASHVASANSASSPAPLRFNKGSVVLVASICVAFVVVYALTSNDVPLLVDFHLHREAIVSNMKSAVASDDFQTANSIYTKYKSIDDAELKDLRARQIGRMQEKNAMAKEKQSGEKEQQLLRTLDTISADDAAGLAKVYAELAALRPYNAHYQTQASLFAEQASVLVEKEKRERAALREREMAPLSAQVTCKSAAVDSAKWGGESDWGNNSTVRDLGNNTYEVIGHDVKMKNGFNASRYVEYRGIYSVTSKRCVILSAE